MTHRPFRILSIQSEVVSGHVGNAGARFALQRLGLDVLALPTVLFSNHPGYGGFKGRATAPDILAELLDGLADRGLLDGVDAILSGYLGLADQAPIVRDAVLRVKRGNPSAVYLFDPVFGDDGGAYARPGVADAMATHLLPLADVVTPNRFELAGLTGRDVDDPASAVAAARSLGRPLVLATSVPLGEAEIGTAAVTADAAWLARTARIPDPPNGTGDLLAALFLAQHLQGAQPGDALASALACLDALIHASRGRKDIALVAHQDLLIGRPALPVRRIG